MSSIQKPTASFFRVCMCFFLASFLCLSTSSSFISSVTAASSDDPQLSVLWKQIFTNYDNLIRPGLNFTQAAAYDAAVANNQTILPNNIVPPTVINLVIRINLLLNVDNKEETFQVDMFVNEWWKDPRLMFDRTKWNLNESNAILRFPSSYTPWLPDTFFFNAVKCTTSDTSLSLKYDGTVYWSRHQTCTFHCDFDLLNFPFDRQTLPMKRTSFTYSSNELVLNFDTASGFRPDPKSNWQNSVWTLVRTYANESPLIFINTHSANTYLVVDRMWQNYAVKMILPLFMLVLISTMSYAIDPGAPPARVAFSVALILSIVTFNLIVSQGLPAINYATLLDWYVWYCFVYTVGALAEYAVVNNLIVTKRWGIELPYLVDDFFMWTMPFVWSMTNLWYWPFYNAVGLTVFLATCVGLWLAANAYRVWWNFLNKKRGMWAPLVVYIGYIRRVVCRKDHALEDLQKYEHDIEQREKEEKEAQEAADVAAEAAAKLKQSLPDATSTTPGDPSAPAPTLAQLPTDTLSSVPLAHPSLTPSPSTDDGHGLDESVELEAGARLISSNSTEAIELVTPHTPLMPVEPNVDMSAFRNTQNKREEYDDLR